MQHTNLGSRTAIAAEGCLRSGAAAAVLVKCTACLQPTDLCIAAGALYHFGISSDGQKQ
jgi:hypothetical protein